MTNDQLKSILEDSGLMDKKQLEKVYSEAKIKNSSLYDLIISRDILPDFYLGKVIADGLGFSYVTLSRISISDEVLNIIPEIVARKQKILAFEINKDGLKLAMADPANEEIKEFVEKKAGVNIIPYFATERDLNNAFGLYRKDVTKTLEDILKEITVGKADGEGPIVKMVGELFLSAHRNRSSDIHIEPYEKNTMIRFRIDGVLHEVAILPKKYHDQVISRIKILSKLKTDEHLSAQDGKLQFVSESETVDVRVSIVPIVEGEKAVLRLLSARARQFSLEELGLSP